VDGKLVIDNWTRQTRGEAFFGSGSTEDRGRSHIPAKHSPEIFVEFCNVRAPADGDEDEAVMDSNPGVRLGGVVVASEDGLMDEAVKMAGEADVAVCVVGLNADWETEGYDRTTLALPQRTDELVEKVLKANPNTVVVTQAVSLSSRMCGSWTQLRNMQGSAITMPWADKAKSIVHTWYLGNATGDAIADVLFGKVNPAGRLSMSFPKRMEDLASHGHFTSEHGKVRPVDHRSDISTEPTTDPLRRGSLCR
jgi:beta-glucosidase